VPTVREGKKGEKRVHSISALYSRGKKEKRRKDSKDFPPRKRKEKTEDHLKTSSVREKKSLTIPAVSVHLERKPKTGGVRLFSEEREKKKTLSLERKGGRGGRMFPQARALSCDRRRKRKKREPISINKGGVKKKVTHGY